MPSAFSPPSTSLTATKLRRYQPLGVVLAIMPWNFPFWQVIRFAAPALCAGNVGLLKHASNVPQCALALEELFSEAGAPDGVFQTLLIGSDRVDAIIADDRVAAVTLTGSEAAGASVAATAGQRIKKTVLELGGSDPFIVMPSRRPRRRGEGRGEGADDQQRPVVHRGQALHRRTSAIADEFTTRFVDGMRCARVGDPMRPSTDIGPLATRQIATTSRSRWRDSVATARRVLTGGKRVAGAGQLLRADGAHRHSRERPGVPRGAVRPRRVARFARATSTTPSHRERHDASGSAPPPGRATTPRRDRFIRDLEAGTVFINGMVASDPRFPFGGVKHSGYGRELGPVGAARVREREDR